MSTFKKFILSAILTFTIGIAYAQITNVKPPPAVDYAEDAAHASGSRGTFVLGVRNDGGAALAGTDGDYIPLTTDATGNLRITAIAEVATAADGGALPALTKVVSGYDGTNVQVLKTDTGGELQVDVLTSGLPTGASTLAEQQTQSTSLSAIDAGIPAALGSVVSASSMPVVIASDQTVPVSGTFWQATQPVSGTFWQETQPVSAASLPLPTGASTLAEQQTQTTSLSAIDAGIPAALGQTTGAASMSVVVASDQTVPVSGTFWQATQPVSGTFWQETQPVSGTFWQATQPVSGTVTTVEPSVSSTTISRVANAASNGTLKASNGSRKGLIIFNDSATNCYYKFAATATTTDFSIKLFANETYTMEAPTYTGIVDFICDAASGSTQVTEL